MPRPIIGCITQEVDSRQSTSNMTERGRRQCGHSPLRPCLPGASLKAAWIGQLTNGCHIVAYARESQNGNVKRPDIR